MTIISQSELNALAAGLSSKYQKDAYRISLFFLVSYKKIGDLAENNPTQLKGYIQASTSLIGDWAQRAADVAKNPFKYLFQDPFKELRQRVRAFAKTWSLDQSFIDAMGD